MSEEKCIRKISFNEDSREYVYYDIKSKNNINKLIKIWENGINEDMLIYIDDDNGNCRLGLMLSEEEIFLFKKMIDMYCEDNGIN